jgi:tetratricopeptide (TPR) repeat protein
MNKRRCIRLCLVTLLAVLPVLPGGCKRGEAPTATDSAPATASSSGVSDLILPEMDFTRLPPALETKIGAARHEALGDPADVNKAVDLGALCYAHGLPQGAVACFEHATRLEPAELTWWYCLGLAYERAADPEQAAAAYQRVLALKEDSRLARTRLAALLLEKDPTRAFKMFEDALATDPHDPIAHAGLGQRALAAGQLDEAARHFRATLKAAPKYGPAHAGLAALLDRQGKSEEAEAHRRYALGDMRLRPLSDQFENLMLQRGLDLETLLSSAKTLADRKQYAAAERLLRQAVEVDESGVRARTELGETLGRQGKITEAVEELERILNLPDARDYAPAKTKLAFALMLLKDYDRAEQLLREVLERTPDDEDALRRFCALALQQQVPDKAVPLLNAALAAAPENAELHQRAGEWFLQLGKPDEARAALRRAGELDPESATTRHELGILLFYAGDAAGAREQLTQALRIDPHYTLPRLALHDLLLREKDYAGLERLLREGLELVPDSADLANALAWHLATCADPSLRNATEAVQRAERACEITQRNDDAMLDTLAAAYAAAGRFDDAQKAIAEAIERAEAANKPDAVKDYQSRRALYADGQAYYESK